MKISNGKGTPIWLSPRRDNGITIIQGTSHIMVSGEEVQELIDAIEEMTEV
jgi:hypothetical protein